MSQASSTTGGVGGLKKMQNSLSGNILVDQREKENYITVVLLPLSQPCDIARMAGLQMHEKVQRVWMPVPHEPLYWIILVGP